MVQLSRRVLAVAAAALLAFAVGAETDGGASPPPSTASTAPTTTISAPTAGSGSGAACSAAKPLGAGDRTIHVRVDGVWRDAFVSVPRSALGHPAPVIVTFHGLRGTGTQMSGFTGLSKLAVGAGFIAVYPDAQTPRRAWAIQPNPHNQDVAFIRALIANVGTRWCVDPRRVSAAGMSNGGGFAARIACDLAGQLAAVVAVSPALTQARDCSSGPPVSILEIHGTSDPIAPYNAKNGRKGVLDWLSDWRSRDRCGSRAAAQTKILPLVTRFVWKPCAKGTMVEHLRVSGGHHQWPGSSPENPGPISGLNASAEVWRFAAPLRSQSPAF